MEKTCYMYQKKLQDRNTYLSFLKKVIEQERNGYYFLSSSIYNLLTFYEALKFHHFVESEGYHELLAKQRTKERMDQALIQGLKRRNISLGRLAGDGWLWPIKKESKVVGSGYNLEEERERLGHKLNISLGWEGHRQKTCTGQKVGRVRDPL